MIRCKNCVTTCISFRKVKNKGKKPSYYKELQNQTLNIKKQNSSLSHRVGKKWGKLQNYSETKT
jgi:protein-arginine kinase activator protein McsA